ncbi:ABC transporter ATP-binding protein [Hyalangium versicolor]|uniref:ABC transporter ATP-binding protein n=1 Tax=Hyalangium versicolor TaxID=2861190 RepID=UPI001CCF8FEE|nr:ABC transporter ATP-binding protein [Hyalangium versicolor]
MDAIVIRNLVKRFRKSTIRREYTTLKSELVRLLKGQRKRIPDDKTYIEAIRGIDLTIPRGKTVGIIGRNGSGKSTLLKLMTGIYTPTSGTIEMNGRISALLDLGAGFHPDFSGRENILINGIILGMTRAEIRARMDQIIEFSELGDFVDEPVRTYSSGMYARLAFAVATHVDPEILIVDEILAVGDEHFSKKSLAKMMEFKAAGKTIVLVTHDLGTIERWCDMGVWIDAGRVRGVGNAATLAAEYRQAVALAEQQAMDLGPAALSKTGGQLPQVVPALAAGSEPAATGQQGSSEANGALSDVKIGAVRFWKPSGEEVHEVDTEDPLDMTIDFVARCPVEDVGFGIALFDSQGTKVYGTNTFIESVPLPMPLPPAGTLRLSLKRVGLTPGTYTLDVSAHPSQGAPYDSQRGLCQLKVRSDIADSGIWRPPHVWSLEPASVSAPAPLSRAVEV